MRQECEPKAHESYVADNDELMKLALHAPGLVVVVVQAVMLVLPKQKSTNLELVFFFFVGVSSALTVQADRTGGRPACILPV